MEKILLNYISSNLHKLWALLAGWVLGLLLLAALDGLIKEIIPDTYIRFSIYLVLLLGWSLYWTHYRKCSRKIKKGRVGFIIAIYAEENHEEKRLKADFISRLRENISAQGLTDTIDICVLKNHVSEGLQDQKSIENFNKKVRGHFYIYGKVRRRGSPENTYYLNLNGVVFHTPLNPQNSKLLTDDFNAVLPKQVTFYESFEFQAFQLTADLVSPAARYITGSAAFFSGDAMLAHTLHTNLQDEFNKFAPLQPHLQAVRDRIPLLLSDETLLISMQKFDSANISYTKEWLTKSLAYNPINYAALLFKAIIDFQVDKDPQKAIATLKRARKHKKGDKTVFYSMAFLQFWIGNYDEALKLTEKIASSDLANEAFIAKQSEDFNLNLLQNGNFKPQLYFWLGFLNYKKLSNLPLALKYFEEFLHATTPEMLVFKTRAEIYLAEVKRSMGI